MNLYSDNDRHAVAWLRELVKDGQIPDGTVDERDIQDLRANDLRRFRQVHLFAGIGGWAYALHLAGWPAARPVWTGSCPCQPWSAAGKGEGEKDARHLWPVFLRLIRECHPPTVFGEQVASRAGREWLARVRDDLEAAGYAVGCADLPACCQGAPHIRSRLFWVADAGYIAARGGHGRTGELETAERSQPGQHAATNGTHGRLADADGRVAGDGGLQRGGQHGQRAQDGGTGERLDDTDRSRLEGQLRDGTAGAGQDRGIRGTVGLASSASILGFWSQSDLIPCRDGKARRAEPGIFPLAAGLPGRVAFLRGAGNSIVPQVATAFVRAFLECEEPKP